MSSPSGARAIGMGGLQECRLTCWGRPTGTTPAEPQVYIGQRRQAHAGQGQGHEHAEVGRWARFSPWCWLRFRAGEGSSGARETWRKTCQSWESRPLESRPSCPQEAVSKPGRRPWGVKGSRDRHCKSRRNPPELDLHTCGPAHSPIRRDPGRVGALR